MDLKKSPLAPEKSDKLVTLGLQEEFIQFCRVQLRAHRLSCWRMQAPIFNWGMDSRPGANADLAVVSNAPAVDRTPFC